MARDQSVPQWVDFRDAPPGPSEYVLKIERIRGDGRAQFDMIAAMMLRVLRWNCSAAFSILGSVNQPAVGMSIPAVTWNWSGGGATDFLLHTELNAPPTDNSESDLVEEGAPRFLASGAEDSEAIFGSMTGLSIYSGYEGSTDPPVETPMGDGSAPWYIFDANLDGINSPPGISLPSGIILVASGATEDGQTEYDAYTVGGPIIEVGIRGQDFEIAPRNWEGLPGPSRVTEDSIKAESLFTADGIPLGPTCGNWTITLPNWLDGGSSTMVIPIFTTPLAVIGGSIARSLSVGMAINSDLLTPGVYPYGLNPSDPTQYTTLNRRWNNDGTLAVAPNVLWPH